MMRVFRNSKFIVALWVAVTILPVVITPLHFLFVDHSACHSAISENGNDIITYAQTHCPICEFDFFWAVTTNYKPLLKRFNHLLHIEVEHPIFIVFVLLPMHIQLRAPPRLY